MIIRFLVIAFLCFFITACIPDDPELPVPLEKAADILVDVHAAEAALQNVFGSKKDTLAQHYYEQIYEIHEIDSTTFAELIFLIRNHPKRLKEVYSLAMEKVDARIIEVE